MSKPPGSRSGILLTKEFQTAMGVSSRSQCKDDKPLTDMFSKMPNVNTVSMIASVFLLASWLGCMIMASFCMILGRRQNIIIRNLVSAVGSIISASSFTSGQMIASRVIIVGMLFPLLFLNSDTF